MDFFILFGICSASWICRFMSFARLGEFSAIVSWGLLWPHSLSLLLGLPDDMNVRSFVIVPHVSEALIIVFFFFFSLFSHCYSDWAISNVLSSSSLIFFLVFSILLMSPSPQFFDLVIVFFHSKISVWYSIVSVSLLRLSIIFIFFQPICNCSLKHFFPLMLAPLDSFSDHWKLSSWCWHLLFSSYSWWGSPGSWYDEWISIAS